MPDVLTIKRPPGPSLSGLLRFVVVVAPPLLLGYLWYRGRPLHFDDRLANGAAHLGLVILGIVGGICFGLENVEKESRSERLVFSGPGWRELVGSWWMFLPLLAPMIVGLTIFADHIARHALDYGSMSTQPSRALLVWLTAFALSVIFMALFGERAELRMSDEGLRWGLTQFAEWTNVHHFAERTSGAEIFHRVQPGLPFAHVPRKCWAEVESQLMSHAIPRDDSVSVLLKRVRRFSLLAFILIAGLGIAAYFSGISGPLSTIVGSLALAFAGVWFIERFRRLNRTTRAKYRRESKRADVRADAPLPPSNDMPALANDAVRAAREMYQLRLDFTPESVERIETILTRLSDPHAEELTDFKTHAESMRWGAYVGEVIRRNFGGDWVAEPGQPPRVRHANNSMTFPVAWCRKRLTDGADDNVWVKFQSLTAMRDKLIGSE